MQINDENLIRQRPDLDTEIRQASLLLEGMLGLHSEEVRADWTLSENDRGRTLIDLRISDWTGSVGYRFAPDELSNAEQMKLRLNRLWGDLLMVRSHVLLDDSYWQFQTQAGR